MLKPIIGFPQYQFDTEKRAVISSYTSRKTGRVYGQIATRPLMRLFRDRPEGGEDSFRIEWAELVLAVMDGREPAVAPEPYVAPKETIDVRLSRIEAKLDQLLGCVRR